MFVNNNVNFLSSNLNNITPSVNNLNNSNLTSSHCEESIPSNLPKFSVVHQNIRSIRKNFDSFLIDIFNMNNLPDLIFLSEIWIYEYEKSNYNILNFNFFASCNNGYASGGVAVFVRNDIYCDISCVNLVSADIVKVVCDIDSVTYCFVCVYRLHEQSINKFVEEFSGFLNNIKYKNCVVLGDFNIDILSKSKDADDYLLLMACNGFISLINEPTRFSLTSSSCIDHIFVRTHKNTDHHLEGILYDLRVTDHAMTGLNFNNVLTKLHDKYIKRSSFHVDFVKLKRLLNIEFWDEVYSSNDPSNAFDKFILILNGLILECSSSSVRVCSKLIKLKPWISNVLLEKINKRNKLRNTVQKHPNCTRLVKFYGKLCKEIKSESIKCKEKYFSKKFECSRGNSKKEWNLVNCILNKTRSQSDLVVNINNDIVSDPKVIADHFNEFFVKIGQQFSINNSTYTLDETILEEPTQVESFFFEPISAHELHRIILSLKNSNSMTSDGVSSNLLKKVSLQVVDVLAHIFNKSVATGSFPDKLKIAEVLPLFKKGNSLDSNNYRPISLLSTFSKIFEKAMKNRIIKFLERTKFFHDNQFGFLRGKSTEGALLKFCEEIYDALNNSKTSSALFIDITKAFDLVNHEILIDKLRRAGFRGFALDWFRSYLSNRKQKVRINNEFSSLLEVFCGVPQGSVLGPILFLIFINSLFSQPFKGNPTAFADDTAFTYGSNSHFDIVINLNHDIDLLRRWFRKHKLIISCKTKYMNFSIYNNPMHDYNLFYHDPNCQKFPIYPQTVTHTGNLTDQSSHDNQCNSNCFKIECVSSFKYLGLFIDSKFDWSKHTSYLKKHFSNVIRLLYHVSLYSTVKISSMVYYALFHSKLQYGIVCWGGAYFNKLSQLLISQKHAVRIICKKRRLSPSLDLFRTLKILPVRYLFLYKTMKIFFIKSGYQNIRHTTSYNLRINNRNLVSVPRFNKYHFCRFYIIIAPKIFNKLPDDIRNIRVLSNFLNKIKIWLLNLNYDEVENLLSVFG